MKVDSQREREIGGKQASPLIFKAHSLMFLEFGLSFFFFFSLALLCIEGIFWLAHNNQLMPFFFFCGEKCQNFQLEMFVIQLLCNWIVYLASL